MKSEGNTTVSYKKGLLLTYPAFVIKWWFHKR